MIDVVQEQDKFRFIIEEARTGRILTRDLKVSNPKILRKLSGSSVIEFDVDYRDPSVQHPDGTGPILFKPWGHWCHVEKTIRGERKIWASGIFKPSEVDPRTGILHAQFEGHTAYPSKLPILFNYNPIAVDPFFLYHKIWQHLQSYPNGNLGVTVYSLDDDGVTKVTPPTSGTQMLPGFSFDGQQFVMDFFAVFIRAVDMQDAGDYLNKLARDIPFDYFEEAEWNEDHTAINKFIQLAYPHGGALQTGLSFRINENILQAKTKIESEVQWASDIITRGWFPGKVYSSELSNADPTRYRRTMVEEDANINSTERAAIWAHRQLSRRQFPNYWESIIVSMHHPNAPFGTYDVGDQIRVQGFMPWVGDVDQVHKIIAISVDEASSTCELTLRAEGAFNYDPIFYEGIDENLIENYSFAVNLDGWSQIEGTWTRDAVAGNTNPGSARVTADGSEKILRATDYIEVEPGEWLEYSGTVFWQNASANPGASPIRLTAIGYNNANVAIAYPIFDAILNPSGNSGNWVSLSGRWKVSAGVYKVKYELRVLESMLTGTIYFDDLYFNKET